MRPNITYDVKRCSALLAMQCSCSTREDRKHVLDASASEFNEIEKDTFFLSKTAIFLPIDGANVCECVFLNFAVSRDNSNG